MQYLFDKAKNEKLKSERGISFEEIIDYLDAAADIVVYDHPNQIQYPNQKIIELVIKDYIWRLPVKYTAEGIVLKTAYPSRASMKVRVKGKI